MKNNQRSARAAPPPPSAWFQASARTRAALLIPFLAATTGQAFAADYYWDTDGSNAGNLVDGTNLGGTGNWDASTSNWWPVPAGALTTWGNTSADVAIFSGAFSAIPSANTVTLSTGSGILANQLRFLRSGYTLTSGDLTLAGTTPTLFASMGESATISSQILGSAGLTKTGGGSVRLTNASNNYTGTVAIQGGSLIISNATALGGTGAVLITSGNDTPSNTSQLGFTGGALVLDGTAAGFAFARDVNFEGRGPVGDRSAAILSLGNNTLSGTLSSAISPLTPATYRHSRINSANGTLTLAGTLNVGGTATTTFTTLGGVNAAGVGNFDITGALAGTGSIEKTGAATLFLNPSSTSGFTGTVRVSTQATGGQQSSVRVTQASAGGTSVFGANTGTNAAAAIDMNGGILEFRNDGNLDFGSLASGKNVYHRGSSTFYTGPAAGGAGVNGVTTLGTFRLAANNTATFNSRNGFGMAFGAWTQESSNNSNTIANNMGGTLTFTGDAWNNADGSARNLWFSGNGNTRIVGNITASGTNKQVIKQGAGELILNGTGGTFTGATSIEGGAVRITDFRSVNNASLVAINLGNAGTTAGSLIIGGTGVATGTAAGLTTSKPILFNSTTGQSAIYANQTGTNPVILNGAITSIATTGNMNLGGSNTADNIINTALPLAGAASGLTKVGAGTWVLNAPNLYTGNTNIQNGTLKLRATGTASDVIANAGAIIFSVQATAQTAGGTLEFRGDAAGATTETLGALTPTAGAGTVRLLGQGGFASNLTFTSLGATTAASSVNFDTTAANGGVITITGQAATTATNLPGTANFQGHLYINGADFATTTAGGVVQAPTYVDAGPIFSNASTALVAAVHNKLTGGFTNAAATVSSLVTNSQTLTLSGNLVVSTGGILQSGGTATIQSDSGISRLINGSGTAATNVAIRVDQLSDVLNLGTATNPVNIGSFTTGGLTKNGAGTLVVFGTNAQTGTTNINEGTVKLSGASSRLSATSASLVIRQGATLQLDGTPAANAVVNVLDGAGTITNVNAAAATFTQEGAGTWNGIFQNGTGVLNVTKGGTTGAPTWSGLNTYTGVTTIGGTTGLVTVNTLADGGVASGIGASGSDASNLVFAGSTAGLVYQGNILDNALTLGSRSASTNRLFTLAAAATGATLSSTASNNNAIAWSNPDPIVNNTTAAATLVFAGTSVGDNTFNPRLVNSSAPATLGITKSGAGQWNLGNSNNTFTGLTTINEGILGLNDNGAIHADSPVVLTPTSASSVAVLQMSGEFTKPLAATPAAGTGSITWGYSIASTTGGAGFAAHSTPLTVAIGGTGSPTALTWGAGGFVGTGGTQNLVLNSTTALSSVDFRNAIDLGGSARTINVLDNGNTGADFATMSGDLSSGAGGGLLKIGAGILRLAGASTYTGTTAVEQGTLVVSSLGSSTGAAFSSVGAGGVAMGNTNAVVLGNASTTGGLLQYVGPGETSDRKIRLRGTTAGNQIHADGSGALILTNVAHDTTETGSKTLSLRGTNTAGNMITSQLSDNGTGNVLSVNVDGGATWILTNSANNYTGTTTAAAGALGIGHNTAIPAALAITNANVFAYGADRTLTNTLNLVNNTTHGFIGDHSLIFNGTNNLASDANTVTTNNSIASGKALILNGLRANALTGSRQWTLDGPGETVINGNFTTTTAYGVNMVKTGNGILTLGTNGATSNWNQAGNAFDLDRGTLRFSVNNAIPTAAASTGLTFSPETATADTATLDLNGTTQTVNALTATTDGTAVIDNTSASPASLIFGANNTAVTIGAATGTFQIKNTGGGALSITKTGTNTATITSAVSATYTGATTVTGGTMNIGAALNGTNALKAMGGTLNITGALSAPNSITNVTVDAGSTLNLVNGAGTPITQLTALSLGSGTGTATLNLELGATSDTFAVLTGNSATTANAVLFNITGISGYGASAYTLLSADSGLNGATYSLGAHPTGYGYTIVPTASAVTLTVAAASPTMYWTGSTDTKWNPENASFNGVNWSTDPGGTTLPTGTPGPNTTVIFNSSDVSVANPTLTTLEAPFAINDLVFDATSSTVSGVTIAAGAAGTLTIAPALSSAGIDMQTGSTTAVTISAPVSLGANQTWTVADAGSTLTASGVVSGAFGLMKAGAGTVVLSNAANTYSLGTNANAGTLRADAVGALGGANTVAIGASGKVVLNVTGTAAWTNAFTGPGTLEIPLAGTAAGNTNPGNLSGFSGIVDIKNTEPTGTPAGAANRGKVTVAAQANYPGSAVTVKVAPYATFFASNGGTVAANFELYGMGNAENLGAIRLDNSTTVSGNVTLFGNTQLGAYNNTATFSGVIGQSGGSYGFTKAGGVVLSGTSNNSYTGVTTLAGQTTLTLMKTGGAIAVPGNVTWDMTSSGNYNDMSIGNATNVGLPQQFGSATVITWTNGVNGRYTHLKLFGSTQTFAGFDASVGGTGLYNSAVVENTERDTYGTGSTTGIVVFDNTADYTFGGSFRNSADTGTGIVGITMGSTTSSASGTQTIVGAISSTGPMTINSGKLALTNGTNASGSVTFPAGSTGTLQANGATLNVNNLSSSDAVSTTAFIQNGTTANSVVTVTQTADGQFGGIFRNNLVGGFNLGLTKAGAALLTLSGANSYTGTTTVTAGTLALSGSGTLGNGANLTISGGAVNLGTLSPTVGAVSITAAAPSGDTISNGSLTGTSYAASNAAGDAIVSANLLVNGSAGLIKTGNGTLTLSGANSYTGTTTVTAGTLRILDDALPSGSAVSLNAGTLDMRNNGSGSGIDINYGNTLTLLATSTVNVDNNGLNTGNAIVFPKLTQATAAPRTLNVTGGNSYSLKLSSLDLAPGTGATTTLNPTTASLIITGNVNNIMSGYTGSNYDTAVLTGTATGNRIDGIISDAAGATPGGGGRTIVTKQGTGTWTLGGLNIYTGATNIDNGTLAFTVDQNLAGSLIFGSSSAVTTAGTLDLSTASATFAGALNVRTNSATANTITIGGGETLTIGGGMSVGVSPAADGQTTKLTATGGGALVVGGATSIIDIGLPNTLDANAQNTTTVDLTGLGSFNANVDNFHIGYGRKISATLLGSHTANSITANFLRVGHSNGANPGIPIALVLGTGTNVIQASAIEIGLSKAVATVAFASQAPGSPGTLTLRGTTGGSSTADMTVGSSNGSSTGLTATGTLDLRGHAVDVLAGTLIMGQTNINGGTLNGSSNGIVSFDSGSFTVNTLNMAPKTGDRTGAANATLNIGGGSFTVNTLGSFTLGSQATAGSSVATLNITGGTFTSNVDIVAGTGTTNSTITLNGGTLDMTGKNIGSATVIDNLNLQSGTLKNVNQINNGGAVSKTTAGTLTIEGTSGWSGNTTVAAGTLVLADGVNVANSALTVGTGVPAATLDVAGTGTIGTVAAGVLAFGSTGIFAADIRTTDGDMGLDRLNLGGDLSIGSGALLTLHEVGDDDFLTLATKLVLIRYTDYNLSGVFSSTLLGPLAPLTDESVFAVGSNLWRINYDDTTDGTNTGEFLTLTTDNTPYAAWAAQQSPRVGPLSQGEDADGDGKTNFEEYAFGTDPHSGSSGPPSIEYTADPGGAIIKTGQPVVVKEGGTYYAVFGRRKDHAAAGLTYTVRFSARMESGYWWTNPPTPAPTTVTLGSVGDDIDVVKVPYPGLIPTGSGTEKARFFKIDLSQP